MSNKKNYNTEKKYYSLTHQENRIWYLEKLHPETSMWNNILTVKFTFNVTFEQLQKAINMVIQQNDGLRLRFCEIEGEPKQYVSKYEEKNFDYFDFTSYGEEEYYAWLKYHSYIPFNIIDNDLFYFAILKFDDESTGFFIKLHHIISDGWSVGLLINQIVENLTQPNLSKINIRRSSYINYIKLEEKYINSKNFQKDKEYWNKVFEFLPEPIPLFPLYQKGTQEHLNETQIDRVTFSLSNNLTSKIYAYKESQKVSIFRIIMSAFFTYFFRIKSTEDIVFGIGTHNRTNSNLKNIIGILANLIPFRITINQDIEFNKLVQQINNDLNLAIKHQSYPYDLLIKDLREKNNISINKLFNIAIVQYFKNLYPENVEVKFHPSGHSENALTIYLSYDYLPGKKHEIEMIIDYNTSIFNKREIRSMFKHVSNILESALENPGKKLSELNLLSEKEKNKLLYELNQTQVYYPKNKIIQELIEEQVNKTPDKIAVVYKNERLTYKELNQKANQLARIIRSKGVKPDDIVAILSDRSLEMVIGVLSIIKSGAAYLPIDPEYPLDRIKFMLEDSKTSILVAQNYLSSRINFKGDIIDLDDDNLYTGDDSNLEIINKPSDLVYIIYTSGSTGTPKGVMIEHNSLVNMSYWYKNFRNLNEKDNTTKYAGFGFDASVWEIFPDLISGATIHVISDDIRLSPHELNKYFNENNITVSFLPTQMCEQFLEIEDNISLRWLDTGGDKLRTYKKKNFILTNNYGPTEYTVCTTSFIVDKFYDNIPIGKPIANTRVYIVDRFNNLLPQGVPGELCISGIGIARGYLNKEELTKQKFLKNPFIRGNKKMYKTGDLARWNFDGNLEYLGRIDQQVKIRGFRIELGEIEQVLLNLEDIKDVTVTAIEDKNNNKFLCAYIVSEKTLNSEKIKKELSEKLPYYMIPSYLVKLDKIPLTPNGKVDKKSLPNPLDLISKKKTKPTKPKNEIEKKLFEIWKDLLGIDNFGINDNFFSLGGDSLKAAIMQGKIQKYFNIEISLNQIFKSPTISQLSNHILTLYKSDKETEYFLNETEKQILKIWQDVLGIEKININDDFFSLGGDSLKAAIMQGKIQKYFNILIPIKDIFENPTITDLSEIINPVKDKEKSCERIHPVEDIPMSEKKKEYYPASSVQKGLFILEQFNEINTTYNVPIIIKIEGKLDKTRLSKSIDDIVNRHESLRTSFKIVNGEPVQIINEKIKLKKYYKESSEENLKYIIQDFIKPFDLKKAPLFRVELIKIKEDTHILLVDFHHIIFDGFSVGIFLKELFEFYQDKKLPELKVQYKDFAQWQKNYLESESIKKQEEFWLKTFSEVPVLNLPTDKLRTQGMDFKGNIYEFLIDKELTNSVKKLSIENRKTLFITLFSAFIILLSKYSSQEDIIVGTPIIGRRNEDFQKIIGMFVNTLPIRSFPQSDKTFKTFLEEVHKNFVETYDNQDYQLENLIHKLNLERESGRNPLFDVVFAFQDPLFRSTGDIKDLKISVEFPNSGTSKFDISMDAQLEKDQLKFRIEYRTSLFELETIKRISSHFVNILKSITENPDQELKQIKMLSRLEQRQLIYEFNRTKSDFPENKLIHQIFEEQVEKNPNKTAVVFKDKKLTYLELNNRSNQIAHLLRDKGVKPNNIVGIMVDRSIEMIIGIMGILKSGALYVPIDPEYPSERIKYILEDTNTNVLIIGGIDRGTLPINNFKGELINLDDNKTYKGNTSNPEYINKSYDLAYIIYTSGSTGKPKGVMIEHRSVVNLITWHKRYYEINETDNCALYASFSFDASVSQFFSPLTSGATLHVLSKDIRLSPLLLNEYFEKNNITYVDLPTEFCEQFMELTENKSLKRVSTGGDKLRKYKKQNFNLIDEYGPTEYTVITTSFLLTSENKIGIIGKPISNTQIYILDKNDNLQPIGVPGELCISGVGLARGYLNNQELTNKKFVNNPFIYGKKMYRTGDLAKWLPDGNIEFLGRIDYQVKIRGFRVELGEIEHTLLKQQKDIKTVSIVAKEDDTGNKFLCAYFVSDKKLDIAQIKQELSKELPSYMIPTYFVQLEKMPMTPSGKIDRKALPEPEILFEKGVEYVGPETRRQDKLLKIWKEVLGVEKLGIKDNFFALGGHSLKTITLVAKLQKEFEVSVNDIFKYQTIEKLSKHIIERKDNLRIKLERLKDIKIEEDKDPEITRIINLYNKETENKYKNIDFTEVKRYKNILLTGSTGYLGINLLYDLLKMGNYEIYLIIRGENEDKCRERLNKKFEYYFNSDLTHQTFSELGYRVEDRLQSVKIIAGDLSEEKFGLDEKLYNELALKIDCIINSAAIVKHYGLYEEFFQSNVKSVQNLLEFALTGRKKDFNHISTTSVGYGNIKGKEKIVFTEDDCDVNQEIDNYYIKTKLEAEKLVISARLKGLNTNIFRIGNIVFNSQSGLFQENIEENAFYNLIKAYVNIGVIPDSNNSFEFSFVDYVSKAILLLFNRKNLINQIYHIQNSHEVKLSDILIKGLNINIDKLSFSDFIDYLYNNFEKSGFRSHIENILLHQGWLSDSIEGKDATKFILVSDRTNFILEKIGFKWKEVEPLKLRKMIIKSLADRIMFLKEVPIFSRLPYEILETISLQAKEENYLDETEILWEGEVNDSFYIIMSGNVEIKKYSKAGWLGTIGILGVREFLGEENIWNGKSSSVIVESIMGEVRVLKFKKEDIIRLLRDYPEFSISFLHQMSLKVSKLESIMVNLG